MNPTLARETSRDAAHGNTSATHARDEPDAADEALSSVVETGHTRAYTPGPSHPHMGGLHTGEGDQAVSEERENEVVEGWCSGAGERAAQNNCVRPRAQLKTRITIKLRKKSLHELIPLHKY